MDLQWGLFRVRRTWQCQRQFRLSQRYGLPTQAAQGLANGSHTDPKPPCNLIVRAALSLEVLNLLSTRSLQAGTPRGITIGTVSYTHLRAHETRHDLVCR